MSRLDFMWPKDPKGYQIVKGAPGNPDPNATLLSQIGRPDTVQPVSGREVFQKIKIDDKTYLKFGAVQTSEDLLSFCEQYGLPTTHAASVETLLQSAKWFRDLMDYDTTPSGIKELIKHGTEKSQSLPALRITRREVSLVADPSGKVRLTDKPQNLLGFMADQLASEITKNQWRVCANTDCGRPFRVGPGAPRRADATTCTDECSDQFRSRNRGKAGRAAARN
jgi:hypothetical protein